jgi:putative tRNA adenosine deaminase-associated protein
MAAFAAVLTRSGGRWRAAEETVADCESVAELANLLECYEGSVRLLLIEQDDEFAAIVRLDDEVRVFLTDGHPADQYPLAALLAEDLEPAVAAAARSNGIDVADLGLGEVADELGDDASDPVAVVEGVPPVRDSVPFGDAAIVEDLGTDPADLVAMCVHPGTLPIDVLVAICEKAGCAEVFDDLRG